MTEPVGISQHNYAGERWPWSRCRHCNQRRNYCAHKWGLSRCPCGGVACWQVPR